MGAGEGAFLVAERSLSNRSAGIAAQFSGTNRPLRPEA
jgi:hypothetical protein